MYLPGRHESVDPDGYRYGFNGMESDDEVKGEGNSYTTEFRQYDPRLGKWKSLDPLMAKYPDQSPYAAFNNNPIFYADPTGLEGDPPKGKGSKEGQRGVGTIIRQGTSGPGGIPSFYKEAAVYIWHAGGVDGSKAGWYLPSKYAEVLEPLLDEMTTTPRMDNKKSKVDKSGKSNDRIIANSAWKDFVYSREIEDGLVYQINQAAQITANRKTTKYQNDISGRIYQMDYDSPLLLFTGPLSSLLSRANTGRNLYRAMSLTEFEALTANKGLTYMTGKELFVSTSASYSRTYLNKPTYDVLVKFTMERGAMNQFSSMGVIHRTSAASKGWASRGKILFKTENNVLNLGFQQNVNTFNAQLRSFGIIK